MGQQALEPWPANVAAEEKLSNVPESSCKVSNQILILDGQKTKWEKKQSDIGNTIPILHCSKIIIIIIIIEIMMRMMIHWEILY